MQPGGTPPQVGPVIGSFSAVSSSSPTIYPTANGTDDYTTLNNILNGIPGLGVAICLSKNQTFRITNQNLAVQSNTHFCIERGSQLILNNARVSAIGPGIHDVLMDGGGLITSLNLNTTDAAPTNWARRGIIEFGGTFASIGKNFIFNDLELAGDFVGTPGTGPIVTASSKLVGLLTTNCQEVTVSNSRIRNIQNECIVHNGNGPNGDKNILYYNNTLKDANHDAIGPMIQNISTFFVYGNRMTNCYAGIEAPIGVIENNFASGMQSSGYWLGGNQILDGIVCNYNNNIGVGNCLAMLANDADFNMGCPGPQQGTLVLNNNQSISCKKTAFQSQEIARTRCVGNYAEGWGNGASGYAFLMGASNATIVTFDSNDAINEGPNSLGGFVLNAPYIGDNNRHQGVTIPWVNIGTLSLNYQPSKKTILAKTAIAALTGSTSLTTLYSHTIKAKTLGQADGIRITVQAGAGNGGTPSAKTLTVRIGGTSIMTFAINNTGQSVYGRAIMFNQLSPTVQMVITEQFFNAAVSTGTNAPGKDTGTDLLLIVEGQLVNAGDSLTLNLVAIEFLTGLAATP